MKSLRDQFEEWKGRLPEVTDAEVELYSRHFELLQKWNQTIGLVSRKSIDLAPASHYADSLFIADFLRPFVKDGLSDLGTGAGFPGMIFAIRYPDITTRLFEKQLRKQGFLTAAVTWLGLGNVEVAGAFPDKSPTHTLTARAVLPKDELYDFVRKRLPLKGVVAVNSGGRLDPAWQNPECFVEVASKEYELPLEQGWRNIRVLERVPRETSRESPPLFDA